MQVDLERTNFSKWKYWERLSSTPMSIFDLTLNLPKDIWFFSFKVNTLFGICLVIKAIEKLFNSQLLMSSLPPIPSYKLNVDRNIHSNAMQQPAHVPKHPIIAETQYFTLIP